MSRWQGIDKLLAGALSGLQPVGLQPGGFKPAIDGGRQWAAIVWCSHVDTKHCLLDMPTPPTSLCLTAHASSQEAPTL
jgi:hypothetical protein